MLRSQFYLTLAITIALLFTTHLNAQIETTINIGGNFSQVIDDQSAGIMGELELKADRWEFEIDGQLQSGDIYRGTTHNELTLNPSDFPAGIKLIADSTLKGYTLDTIGRDTNGFITINIPIEDFEFDIGIGGKQATPWGNPNALSELLPKGYNRDELEALGLDTVTPSPRGVPFQDGTFAQAYLATSFKKYGIDFDVKGILQLSGADKAHQAKIAGDWAFGLWGNVNGTIGVELILMSYQQVIHYEKAIFTGIQYTWN